VRRCICIDIASRGCSPALLFLLGDLSFCLLEQIAIYWFEPNTWQGEHLP
jgi:hypothetical protein